jgi:hypothetical protein
MGKMEVAFDKKTDVVKFKAEISVKYLPHVIRKLVSRRLLELYEIPWIPLPLDCISLAENQVAPNIIAVIDKNDLPDGRARPRNTVSIRETKIGLLDRKINKVSTFETDNDRMVKLIPKTKRIE